MSEEDYFKMLLQNSSGLYGGLEGMTLPAASGDSSQLIDPTILLGLRGDIGSIGIEQPTAEYDTNPRLNADVSLPLLGGLLGLSGKLTPATGAKSANLSYRAESGDNTFGLSGLLGDTGFGSQYNEIMADYIRKLSEDEYLGLYGGLRNEKPFVGINYRNRF